MYEREDGNNLPNQTGMSGRTRNRRPQYNERNCGYDCGYGCKKYKDGGAESDGEKTVVGEASDADAQNEDGQESLSASQASVLSSNTAVSEGTGLQLSSSQESDDMSDSRMVEPNSSGGHSPASASGSTRSLSPIPWIITVPSPLPMTYYFLQSPLRLSHEIEDCRGDPSSHLVFPDRSRLSYRMDQLATQYAPAYWNVSPPSFGAC